MRDSLKFVLVGGVVALGVTSACRIEPPIGRPGFGNVGREPVRDPEPVPEVNCVDDRECSLSQRCVSGFCGERPSCEEDAECSSNLCVDDRCHRCSTDFEYAACPAETFCDFGVCSPSAPDFEFEIEPLLTTTACTACHQVDTLPLPSTLGLDVGTSELYNQLLEPGRNRVSLENPEASTLITKPVREDPPNHPVGVWDPAGPEVALMLAWIRGGAPRFSPCRAADVFNGQVDCFEIEKPENLCASLVIDGRVQYSAADACARCNDRFSSFERDALACLAALDAGPSPDAGLASDGGGAEVNDAGSDADAGILDAGEEDAG